MTILKLSAETEQWLGNQDGSLTSFTVDNVTTAVAKVLNKKSPGEKLEAADLDPIFNLARLVPAVAYLLNQPLGLWGWLTGNYPLDTAEEKICMGYLLDPIDDPSSDPSSDPSVTLQRELFNGLPLDTRNWFKAQLSTPFRELNFSQKGRTAQEIIILDKVELFNAAVASDKHVAKAAEIQHLVEAAKHSERVLDELLKPQSFWNRLRGNPHISKCLTAKDLVQLILHYQNNQLICGKITERLNTAGQEWWGVDYRKDGTVIAGDLELVDRDQFGTLAINMLADSVRAAVNNFTALPETPKSTDLSSSGDGTPASDRDRGAVNDSGSTTPGTPTTPRSTLITPGTPSSQNPDGTSATQKTLRRQLFPPVTVVSAPPVTVVSAPQYK